MEIHSSMKATLKRLKLGPILHTLPDRHKRVAQLVQRDAPEHAHLEEQQHDDRVQPAAVPPAQREKRHQDDQRDVDLDRDPGDPPHRESPAHEVPSHGEDSVRLTRPPTSMVQGTRRVRRQVKAP